MSDDNQQRAAEAAHIADALAEIADTLEEQDHPTGILRAEETAHRGISRLWGGGK